MRRAVLAIALCVMASGVSAQDSGPFVRLAGQWSGSGTLQLSNGSHEALRCRASYDVLKQGHNLQFSIRCASDSYNFDLRSSADYTSGKVTGIWSESSLNAGGTLTGKAEGERISAVANSQAFSASLTLITRGSRQSVAIKSRNPKSSVAGASISLRRS